MGPAKRAELTTHHFVNQVPNLKWENKVTLRSLEYLMEFDITGYLERISPTPLLMIVSHDDSSTPTDLALEAFQLAREPKELMIIKADHYASYLEDFDTTSAAARDFFVKNL